MLWNEGVRENRAWFDIVLEPLEVLATVILLFKMILPIQVL